MNPKKTTQKFNKTKNPSKRRKKAENQSEFMHLAIEINTNPIKQDTNIPEKAHNPNKQTPRLFVGLEPSLCFILKIIREQK